MTPLAVPRYGTATLAEVMPSVVATLLPPGSVPAPLELQPTRHAVVLLLDGLGLDLLSAHAALPPFLAGLLPEARALDAGCPATTATSLTSLGTGLPPGVHGMVGYDVVVPGEGWVLNALRWDPRMRPEQWQPRATWFERAAAAGIAVTRVGPAEFDGTGLTEAGLRGGAYAGAATVGERIAAAVASAQRDAPTLTYVYYGDLDAAGHRSGVDSLAWRLQLAHVDRLAEQLAAALPAGAALWITADHGMVDVPADRRIDLAAEPDLQAGVTVCAGEPRARYLTTAPGAAGDVRAAWASRLGDDALVLDREEAIAQGWFGPVDDAVRPRFGDVVALARGPIAMVDSARMPPAALALVGHHGSVTPAELRIPLLEFRTG